MVENLWWKEFASIYEDNSLFFAIFGGKSWWKTFDQFSYVVSDASGFRPRFAVEPHHHRWRSV